MNKTILAMLLAPMAANAATVYDNEDVSFELGGRVEARGAFHEDALVDASRLRFNVDGQAAINDRMYVKAFFEVEMKTTEADSSLRHASAGIGDDYGELLFGKTNGSLGVMTDTTDIMSFHGNTAAPKLAHADRDSGMIAYVGNFHNTRIAANYRFDEATEQSDGTYGTHDSAGYAFSFMQKIGNTGLGLGWGYAEAEETDEVMFSATYEAQSLYLAALATSADLAEVMGDFEGYEFAINYAVGLFELISTYNYGETNEEISQDNLAVELKYNLTSNATAWVSYNVNLIDQGDLMGRVGTTATMATEIDSENELALGVRYNF